MESKNQRDYQSFLDEETVDIKELLYKFISHWRLFALTIPLALTVAYFINRYSNPIYKMTSSVLISLEKSGASELEGLMGGFGVSSSRQAYYNELEIMKSLGLTESVVKDLGLEISYYGVGRIRLTETYKDGPYYVEFDKNHNQLTDCFFEIEWLSENKFHISIEEVSNRGVYNYSSESTSYYSAQDNLDQVSKFGDWIQNDNYKFRLLKKEGVHYDSKSNANNYKFKFNTYQRLIKFFNRAVNFSPIKDASVLNLSMEGTHKGKLVDYLNTLTTNYIAASLSDKNLIADKTIDFIETQLSLIGDTLQLSEMELESFRSEMGVMDISFEANQAAERFVELDNQRSITEFQLNYYGDILTYIEENEINAIVAPSVVGIKDPILVGLVASLQQLNLERSKLDYSMQSVNPILTQLQVQIDQTRGALLANVKNLILATELKSKDIKERISFMEQRFATLPATERQMLTIQRKYGIHDKMFTFLLEKRAEAGITKAANKADHKVINPARDFGNGPVRPNKSMKYAIAFIIALLLPVVYILLKDFFRTSISTIEDLEKLTNIPILGAISFNTYDFAVPVVKKPKSNIAESIRAIRTNLNFMVPGNAKTHLIALTSSVSGEGKHLLLRT